MIGNLCILCFYVICSMLEIVFVEWGQEKLSECFVTGLI